MNLTLLESKLNEITNSLYEIDYKNLPISLFEGVGGISYFFFEKINSAYSTKKDDDFFLYLVELLVEKLNNEDYSFTYCDGMCGNAFVLKRYRKKLKKYGYDIEQLLEDMDSILIEHLQNISNVENINTDFLHGSFGILYYFIFFKERSLKFKTVYLKNVKYILSYINNAKINNDLKVNYGLAHGLCSIMNIIKLYLENIDRNCETSKLCLNLCLEMYTVPEINFNQPSLYPSISTISDFNNNSKNSVPLGWCYGDQTISTTLYNISTFENDQKLYDLSHNIALHWAKRDSIRKALLNENFYDYMICHGVGSIALYNKIWFDITKNDVYHDNYLFFMTDLLTKRSDIDNVAGYKRALINNEYEKSYGLLTGISGVGLLILNALSPENKSWYNLLLI